MSDIDFRASTNQEALELVWNHFITNRHGPGITKEGLCVAYDPDRPHRRCAVGVLATRGSLCELAQGMRLMSAGCIIRIARQTTSMTAVFLGDLQGAHDVAAQSARSGRGSFRARFATALRDIARKHDLTIPNDSDQMPARWSAKVKRQPVTKTMRRLAAQVPAADDWLRSGRGM